MDPGLASRVVLVTGASRGIGREIALSFAGEGAVLACVATTEEGASAVARECEERGARARGFAVDVADLGAVQDLAKEVLGAFDRLDVLVNNAGVARDGVFLRMSQEDWDRVIAVNLKGCFNTTRAFARTLLRNRGARVINLASVVGIGGNAGQANYAASKGGVIALTRSLALEFGGRGVTVNAVAPGLIETDMTRGLPEAHRREMAARTALGRVGTPADVAGAVLWLASRQAAYVTGQVVVVDGGMRF